MLAATTREAARRFGDRTAYVTEAGWSLSYRDLDAVSDEVAAGMLHRGVGAGDVVALVVPPGPEYVAGYLAAAKVGAITAGVNTRLSERERTSVLEVAGPKLTIAAPGFAPADGEAFETEPSTSVDGVLAGLRRRGETVPVRDEAPDAPAAIVFTSGTTGTPKGALYCNRQLAFITLTDVGDAWGVGGSYIAGTAFAHVGVMTKVPGTLRRGGTTFMMAKWRAGDALALTAREHMTMMQGVPSQLALMLRHPDFDSYDLSSVTFILVGGGPVTPALVEEARRRIPSAKLVTRYSCTESGTGLGTRVDDPDEDALVSVGRPHAGIELAIVDADGARLPDGEIGEVCLRSPAVMTGYWQDDAATAAAFTADGFVRTGDLGWVDDRGRLRLNGRTKEMYVRGGFNVYPVEVESVLSTHPDVASIAVVPRPDPVMGEIGVAVVVPRAGAPLPTLAALREHARDTLAAYKLPEAIEVRDALPLTAMEKLDRRTLTAQVAAGDDPSVG
jgi:acyl-CoA synthetase (AMP-forming)/AMP-acid ligase II